MSNLKRREMDLTERAPEWKLGSVPYDKLKLGILVLLVVSLPFYYQISNVLLAVGAALTVLRASFTRQFKILKPDLFSIALIAYFMLEVVGLIYTRKENLRIGFFTLDRHQALVLMPLLFADVVLSSKPLRTLLMSFVASCLAAGIICAIANIYLSHAEYGVWLHEWRFSHNRFPEPIGMDAVYFAMYSAFAVLITLNFIRETPAARGSGKIIACILILILLFVIIVATGARTTTVALIAIIIFNLVRYAIVMKAYKTLILAAIIPLIFAGLIFLNPVVTTRFLDIRHDNYEASNYGSYFARWKIWEPGLEAIGENFWVGVGTGDHQTELDEKFVKYNFLEGVTAYNMHNQYLQTMLNFGVVGLLLLAFIFRIQIRDSLAKGNWLQLSFMLLFMLACLTETTLTRNKGVMFFLLFGFIFFRSIPSGSGNDQSDKDRGPA